MEMMFVTYAGDSGTRFNRDYYVANHLPLVLEAWGPHGLESATAFFPAGNGAGIIALCVCVFQSRAAMNAALCSPETPQVMADVLHFTDVKPTQSQAVPL